MFDIFCTLSAIPGLVFMAILFLGLLPNAWEKPSHRRIYIPSPWDPYTQILLAIYTSVLFIALAIVPLWAIATLTHPIVLIPVGALVCWVVNPFKQVTRTLSNIHARFVDILPSDPSGPTVKPVQPTGLPPKPALPPVLAMVYRDGAWRSSPEPVSALRAAGQHAVSLATFQSPDFAG